MRPRYDWEPNARPHFLADRRRTPPLPKSYGVRHRDQSETNYPEEHNKGKRLGRRGAPRNVRLPPIPGRHRPPNITPTILAEARISIDIT